MTSTERLAEAEGDGHHGEDDEGAGPQVVDNRLFDHSGEGEDTDHTEGEEQLQRQDAEDLKNNNNNNNKD